jgi:hypothetical protein
VRNNPYIKTAVVLVNGENAHQIIKHLKEAIAGIEEEIDNHPDTTGIGWTSWDFSVELYDVEIPSILDYVKNYADQLQEESDTKEQTDIEAALWFKRTLSNKDGD